MFGAKWLKRAQQGGANREHSRGRHQEPGSHARIPQPPGRGASRPRPSRRPTPRSSSPASSRWSCRAPRWLSPSTMRPRPSLLSVDEFNALTRGAEGTLDSSSADVRRAADPDADAPGPGRHEGGVRCLAAGARQGGRDRRAQAWLMSPTDPVRLRARRDERRRQEQHRRRHVSPAGGSLLQPGRSRSDCIRGPPADPHPDGRQQRRLAAGPAPAGASDRRAELLRVRDDAGRQTRSRPLLERRPGVRHRGAISYIGRAAPSATSRGRVAAGDTRRAATAPSAAAAASRGDERRGST